MTGRIVANWSFTIGRPWGVPIRLHFFLVVFALLTLAATSDMLQTGLLTLGVLMVSLLLHELAHAFAATRLGGKVDQIVLGPFGGLAAPRVPDEPEVQVFVALAGPLVHLALVVCAMFGLIFSGVANVEVVSLMQLGFPATTPDEVPWLLAVKLTLFLNWLLLLLNLLPAYPFDGGPALRATLWPILGQRRAAVATCRTAMVVACALCLLPLVIQNSEPHQTLPHWVPMVTLAIFLFFSAQQDAAALQRGGLADETPGYHVPADGVDLLEELWNDELDDVFDDDLDNDLDNDAVLVQQRYDQRRQRARQAAEEYEDAQVDDILARLHEASINDLTGEERALLQRVSERYRRRGSSIGEQDKR